MTHKVAAKECLKYAADSICADLLGNTGREVIKQIKKTQCSPLQLGVWPAYVPQGKGIAPRQKLLAKSQSMAERPEHDEACHCKPQSELASLHSLISASSSRMIHSLRNCCYLPRDAVDNDDDEGLHH